MGFFKRNYGSFIFGIILAASAIFFFLPKNPENPPQTPNDTALTTEAALLPEENAIETENIVLAPDTKDIHIKTPENVKAIYMTSTLAAIPSMRNELLKIADETEINAIVLDIKDSTGIVPFLVKDQKLKSFTSDKNRIKNLESLIEEFHKKNIYVIGRIAVFQDPVFVSKYPTHAVKTKSGSIWKDRKGISWVDAGSKDAWEYAFLLAKESYERGFDEINFDYVRFPSDGNMEDMVFPISGAKRRSDVIKDFFSFLDVSLRSENIPISVDIFGLTTTSKDDVGVGQIWENAIPYFDFVSPMIYPSHFAAGTYGFKNPAEVPGEIFSTTLREAIKRTEKAGHSKAKIRPWVQDFDLGAEYTPQMVRAQINSAENLGINSWAIWNASNIYTVDALKKE